MLKGRHAIEIYDRRLRDSHRRLPLFEERRTSPWGSAFRPRCQRRPSRGFKYFRLLGPLFDHLHRAATERDRAGKRQLFYDRYASLLLLYFFNPTVTSLRGLQQTTTLESVQQRLHVRRTSLGSLSEAAYVFDAALLHEVLTALGAQLRPQLPLAEQAALAQLIAVDGSLLPALPADDLGPVAGRPVRAARCLSPLRSCARGPSM